VKERERGEREREREINTFRFVRPNRIGELTGTVNGRLGEGVVNERGEGGEATATRPPAFPPTGEIFFHSVPVLSEIFLVRDFFSFPIFYL
jgi:hypothetical protein